GSGIRTDIPSVVKRVLHRESECRIACGDTVEVVRVALRLHESLAPTVRTPFEIGITRRLSVIVPDQSLRGERGQMDTEVAEVHLCFGITCGPGAIVLRSHPVATPAFVAHVRGRERN